jgi:hypothetical protein
MRGQGQVALRIFTQRKPGLWDPLGHEMGTVCLNGIRVALSGALSPYLALAGPGVRIFLGYRGVL